MVVKTINDRKSKQGVEFLLFKNSSHRSPITATDIPDEKDGTEGVQDV